MLNPPDRHVIKCDSMLSIAESFDGELRELDDILVNSLGFPKMHQYLDNQDMAGPAVMLINESFGIAVGRGDVDFTLANLICYLERGLEDEWTKRESRDIEPLLSELKDMTEAELINRIKVAINTDKHYSNYLIAI